jgi:hypothetical protein
MLGKETRPAGEDAAIRGVIEASRAVYEPDDRPRRRGQHPKHHGCVRAEFVVEPELPPEYRVGLFREPRTYPAWIRFSSGGRQDDRQRDAHGMAIKLMGVEGPKVLEGEAHATTHDFVMVDNPVFFIPDAVSYARFSSALVAATGKTRSLVYSALGFLPDGPRTLATLVLLYFLPFRLGQLFRLLAFAGKRVANPLTTRYWSTTPYLIGEGQAMKFSAVPDVADARPPAGGSPDYLREAMAERLRAGDVHFDFRVQLQADERSTPVEDPTVDWGESVAPFRTVARIRIPAQEFQSSAQMAFCEDLAFTPWHALPEHRPLGGINRTRREVYTVMSRLRHDLNGTAAREPDPDDPPVGPRAVRSEPTTFSQVLEDELVLIGERRRAVERGVPWHVAAAPGGDEGGEGFPPPSDDQRMMAARVRALNEHVTGLSFSGGGIRSGTFAVGFLQGLATLGLLKRFDYLSTVSGGGYAGAWITAWLKREGSVENIERQLNANRVAESKSRRAYLTSTVWDAEGHEEQRYEVVDEEPEALRHLRSYSSYLNPRPGLLSVDTWTVILIWARNVLINMMMLLPCAVLWVALARLVVYFYGYLNEATGLEFDPLRLVVDLAMLAAGLAGLGLALTRNSTYLTEFRRGNPRYRGVFDSGNVQSQVNWRIVYPALAAVVFLSVGLRWALWQAGAWFDRPTPQPLAAPGDSLWQFAKDAVNSHLGLLDPPNLLGHALALGVVLGVGAIWVGKRDGTFGWKFVGAAFMAGASGGVLVVLIEVLTRRLAGLGRPDLMATFIPPLGLLILVVGLIVEVALLGRTIGEAEREWWARVSGMMTLTALQWLVGMATVVYVPALWLSAGGLARAAIASGWLSTAAFGVLTGRYVLPRVKGQGLGLVSVTTIASVAAQAFLIGLLGTVALLVSAIANVPSLSAPRGDLPGPFEYYIEGVKGTRFATLVAILFVSWVLYKLAQKLIDVNLFSLNAMYANRLTRCYLGASRSLKSWARRWGTPRDPRVDAGAPSISGTPAQLREDERDANPVTGFDPRDDIDLADLRIGAVGRSGRQYVGPHLLVNTTLNLVGGDELAWRDRKGESFTLSPLYCGSKGVGYGKTELTGDNLTLGRAIAISGAAVDPNMSFYQSAPLTALLTIFNARLGYWVEKPRPTGWRAASPKLGDLWFTEFFGRTDNTGEFVHISDGGHFENLGVYELIRRRCRYIVAVDAAQDPDASDDNLATLIRLCRIDFGVRIKLDTSPLRAAGPDKLTRTHVAVGRIHYDDVDHGEMPGVIVYVKTSLTGDEPPDIQKYARTDPSFPHDPTDLRQSFDEEQFECYRALGDHIAREVFEDAVSLVLKILSTPTVAHKDYVQRLFSAVQARWAEAPVDENEGVLEATRSWAQLEHEVSTNPELAALSRDLYPELPPAPAAAPAPADRERAELHAVSRMLSISQTAWLALGLKRYSGLPMNRGWMNSFRRWADTEVFQRLWPVLRSQLAAEFVRFCEDQLHVASPPPVAVRLVGPVGTLAARGFTFEAEALDELADEFAREWPDDALGGRNVPRPRRGIPELVARAAALGLPELPVWLIVQTTSGPVSPGAAPRKFVAGIILAATFPDHPDVDALDPDEQPPIELFLWVRPAHRSIGMASLTARNVVQTISEELAAAHGTIARPLWARYPRASPGDDDRAHEMWRGFFARYDFRRKYPTSPGVVWEVSLLRRDP